MTFQNGDMEREGVSGEVPEPDRRGDLQLDFDAPVDALDDLSVNQPVDLPADAEDGGS